MCTLRLSNFTDFTLFSATAPFLYGFTYSGTFPIKLWAGPLVPAGTAKAENRKHNNWADNTVPPIFHPALKSFLFDYSAMIKCFVRVPHSSLNFLAQKSGT